MVSINRVTLLGRVGKDPEVRSTTSGNKIVSFSVATSSYWVDKFSNEKHEKTEWHNVVVFSPGLVSIIERSLAKGHRVYIEGSLQTRKWQDKMGNPRYTTEVVLQGLHSNLIILEKKASDNMSHPMGDSRDIDTHTPNDIQKAIEDKLDKELKDELDDDSLPF
ncbi:MAG: single-stranded DNA-binding protein [Candidatus Xenolissoclinum pacificiensis L6]|uniref:Single-stranded DNA-binding protein n=1 Tax=Candidatus Xenolissoclinum pacificiensis L6 TaxID=1401685 RepID=W2V2P2_9RICK|nr:MAG: single-stranded DNA-binding protein [Candidatus Xenolissoclinum pacificiensis L6]